MLSLVAVPSSQSANGIVLSSSLPCSAMTSDILFDGTINRTMCFSREVHRNAFNESGVAQIEAMGRTSATTSPVSVRLVQNQVQVHQESGVFGGGQSGTIHTSVPAQAQANLRILLLLSCLHLSLSFTAHFPAASPTHKPKYLPPLPLPLVAPYPHTYTGERLAFAAESVCFFSLNTRTVLDRANTLLFFLPHTHPPTCLQSPLLRTTSHTPASCAPSCNGRSGMRLSMSATSPRSLRT